MKVHDKGVDLLQV